MNDEIKEKIKAYYIGNDIDKVLDYITNLQQENERANQKQQELILNLQQENERKERLITQYGEGMCAYANRIEKAIEYMQENYNELTDYGYKKEIYDDLLNILQNGSDDNE